MPVILRTSTALSERVDFTVFWGMQGFLPLVQKDSSQTLGQYAKLFKRDTFHLCACSLVHMVLDTPVRPVFPLHHAAVAGSQHITWQAEVCKAGRCFSGQIIAAFAPGIHKTYDQMSHHAEAYKGVQKGRWALLEAGRTQPGVIDSGASDWDPQLYGEELGRKKPSMSFQQQVCICHVSFGLSAEPQSGLMDSSWLRPCGRLHSEPHPYTQYRCC